MGAEQEAVVLEFIGYFREGWPADLDAPLSLLAEEAYYQIIVPVTEPIQGRTAIKKAWQRMQRQVETQKHEMIAVGSGGRFVFTERVDHSLTEGVWDDVPLVAVFELDGDNKIVAWREYLDSANVARQHGKSSIEEMFSMARRES